MFDIANEASFKGLEAWIAEIKTYGPKDLSIIIAGNKADLQEQRKMSFEEIESIVECKFNIKYIEVSAKTSYNVKEIFKALTLCMTTIANAPDDPNHYLEDKDKSISLSTPNFTDKNKISKGDKKKSSCC